MPGWKPLIVCDGPSCQFSDLILLVNNLIHDLVLISTLLAVIVFVWAGFLLLTSGGNKSTYDKAKGMLWKVLIGYLWILAAWLIVYTITSVLLKDAGYSILGAPRPNP